MAAEIKMKTLAKREKLSSVNMSLKAVDPADCPKPMIAASSINTPEVSQIEKTACLSLPVYTNTTSASIA